MYPYKMIKYYNDKIYSSIHIVVELSILKVMRVEHCIVFVNVFSNSWHYPIVLHINVMVLPM